VPPPGSQLLWEDLPATFFFLPALRPLAACDLLVSLRWPCYAGFLGAPTRRYRVRLQRPIRRIYEVIIRLKSRRLYLFDSNNRISVTSIKTIGVNKTITNSFIILPDINYLYKAFRNLFKNIFIDINKINYLNDDLNIEYTRYFKKYIINKRISKYYIFILDDYNSYFEFDFVEYY
jgi:hypothetical protein